jgi:DNA repair protein RecO
MEKKRDLAITLRAVAFEERHRIVTAITENHGQISALARNSIQSRRFGGTLEPFTAAEWYFSEKPGAELVSLEEATVRRSFDGLRGNFERLSLASVFNELLLRLAPQRQPCPELFKLHSNALALLEEGAPDLELLPILNAYLAKLLQWSGNQPRIHLCFQCRTPIQNLSPTESLTCLIEEAAWICSNCRAGSTTHITRLSSQKQGNFQEKFFRVAPLAIHDLSIGMESPIRKVPEVSLASKSEHEELFRYLEALFIFHIPGFDREPLRALKFLNLESSVLVSR